MATPVEDGVTPLLMADQPLPFQAAMLLTSSPPAWSK
jgi:hypothetical protein